MRQRRGFTLVELLVVIGIIALLIALLLPALGRAQRHARMTACLSNQRQLVMALMMYCQENKGAFPGGPGNSFFDGAGPFYYPGLASWDTNAFNPYSCNKDEKSGPTFLEKYVSGSEKIPACPAEPQVQNTGSDWTHNRTSYWYPMSLVYTPDQIWNAATISPATVQTPQKLSAVRHPAQEVVIIDRKTYHEKLVVDIDKTPTGEHSTKKEKRLHVTAGFADGHCAARNVYEMYDSDVNWTGRYQIPKAAGILGKDFE